MAKQHRQHGEHSDYRRALIQEPSGTWTKCLSRLGLVRDFTWLPKPYSIPTGARFFALQARTLRRQCLATAAIRAAVLACRAKVAGSDGRRLMTVRGGALTSHMRRSVMLRHHRLCPVNTFEGVPDGRSQPPTVSLTNSGFHRDNVVMAMAIARRTRQITPTHSMISRT